MEKGVKGSEKGVKWSDRTMVSHSTFVLSLPLTPLHPLSLLILLFLFNTTSAQEADSCRLRLEVENHHFFRNNEYGSKRLDGYTLPGFYLRPKVVWQVEPHVSLSAGVHWLNYWGAHAYPSTLTYVTSLPDESDTASSMHLMPWMQVKVAFPHGVSLVLGSLDNRDGHHLPLPLYNPELRYAADPEAGVQLLVERPWLEADLWVNWLEFIFNRSRTQERFYTGLSAKLKLSLGDWTLYLPLHAIATHHGGEGLRIYSRNHNQLNAGSGLGAAYRNGGFEAQAEMLALYYQQRTGSIHPFDRGWGLYPTLRLRYREGGLMLGYWSGDGYIPILGAPLFSNASANTDGLTVDRNRMLTVQAEYRWRRFKACEVTFEGDVYYLFPWSGNEPPYGHLDYKDKTLVGFGIHVKLNPSLPLLR